MSSAVVDSYLSTEWRIGGTVVDYSGQSRSSTSEMQPLPSR